jgi:hypothetical protein
MSAERRQPIAFGHAIDQIRDQIRDQARDRANRSESTRPIRLVPALPSRRN